MTSRPIDKGTGESIRIATQDCVAVGDIPFTQTTYDGALELIRDAVQSGASCQQVIAANAYSVVVASHVDGFKRACQTASLVVPDGMPIVWASRIIGEPLEHRIAGPDLMWGVLEMCSRLGFKAFLLGGQPECLSALADRIGEHFGDHVVAGSFSPAFGEWTCEQNREMVERVNRSEAQILFLGVSTPKQDIWIMNHRNELRANVALGVGAAFDFHSGRVKRAPAGISNVGLEWFHRLMSEPRRMWRRYLLGNLQFLTIAGRQILIHLFKSCLGRTPAR